MNNKKESNDSLNEINNEDDIYARFKHVEEDANENVENMSVENNSNQEKQEGYLESHTVVTKASKISRTILFGFYVILILIGAMVFFMLRSDRYQFYLVKDEVRLEKGSEYQVELVPKNVRYFDYLNYKYEIADENVATVDEFGTIKAVGSGTTTLKISLSPGFTSKKMTIVSESVSINSIDLLVYKDKKLQSGNSITLNPNQSVTLKAIANNDENMNMTVEYSSSDPSVATVDEFGNVTALSEGITTIVGSNDGISGEIAINVKSKVTPVTPTPTPSTTKVTKVDIGTNQVTKYVSETLSLSPVITPNTTKTNNITWTSSNSKVATVDKNGVVKTLKKGTAVITVNVDGVKDTCTVIVKEKSSSTPTPSPTPTPEAPAGTQINSKEVNLSKTSLTIEKGKTQSFDIKVTGAAGIISVISSNDNIAKISTTNSDCNNNKCFFDAQEGSTATVTYVVTGVGSGTAYINVTLDDLVSYSEKEITGTGKVGILVK